MGHDVPQSLERLAVAGERLGAVHPPGDPDDELLNLRLRELQPRDGDDLLGGGPHAAEVTRTGVPRREQAFRESRSRDSNPGPAAYKAAVAARVTPLVERDYEPLPRPPNSAPNVGAIAAQNA